MNTKIFKYAIDIHEVNENNQVKLTLPYISTILSAIEQDNKIMIYALVKLEPPQHLQPYEWVISVIGTGHAVTKEPGEFINTVKLDGGTLIYHVFADLQLPHFR